MPNLTDYIEDYLKKLLALSSGNYVEVQRRELAGKFSCVPSQINYVLQRRFSIEHGYLVESKRGGGGCIRIYRVEPARLNPWRELAGSVLEEEFEPQKARHQVKRILEEKLISRREARLLEAIVDEKHYADTGLSLKSARRLQQKLLSAALEELLKDSY